MKSCDRIRGMINILKKNKVCLMKVLALSGMILTSTEAVLADSHDEHVIGKNYCFAGEDADDSKHEFSTAKEFETTDVAKNLYGDFYIQGDVELVGDVNGVPTYVVNGGNIDFFYTYDDSKLNADEDGWYLCNDDTSKIDDFKLNGEIEKGAIVVQTSKDGEIWVTDMEKRDTLKTVPEEVSAVYTSSDVQLVNGCYYRVIVVYEMKRKVDSTQIAFVSIDDFEYKKFAEVYTFFVGNEKANQEAVECGTTLKYSLGSKERVKDYDGYFGTKTMESSDPHYGWDLGSFFVSGYTDKVEDDENNPVFLKNVGDKVTLWFNLKQPLESMNGDDSIRISEDHKGYDKYFQTKATDFGHGALIIRYTDYENVKHEPMIYTNFLEAQATVGADTIVQLFEEGDYEVALDYELENNNKVVFGRSVLPEYSHYRIFFKFSIRNGNCMAYPFDLTTGEELQNNALTANGFYLDLAKSRYLKINVTREVFEDGMGGITQDVRFNRPAKDGDTYTEEGIYTLTVSNTFTGQETIKRICVGTNDILKIYAATGLSVEEIQTQLALGATVAEDGTLVMPEE